MSFSTGTTAPQVRCPLVSSKNWALIACDVQNNGKIAFQHVFHVHFHIILKPDEKHGLTIEEWPCIEPPKEEHRRCSRGSCRSWNDFPTSLYSNLYTSLTEVAFALSDVMKGLLRRCPRASKVQIVVNIEPRLAHVSASELGDVGHPRIRRLLASAVTSSQTRSPPPPSLAFDSNGALYPRARSLTSLYDIVGC